MSSHLNLFLILLWLHNSSQLAIKGQDNSQFSFIRTYCVCAATLSIKSIKKIKFPFFPAVTKVKEIKKMEVKNPLIELMLKSCDVEFMKNYSNEFYGPLRSNDSKADNVVSLHLVSLIVLSIIIFTNFNFDKEKLKNRVLFVLKSPALRELLYVIICFLVSLIFVPIVSLIAGSFKLYRAYVAKCLKNDKSSRFKGFLVGEDSFWVCEDDNAKSVINVLAFVNCESENMHEKLLTSIRDRIHSKLMLPNAFPKMFYRKKRDDSGYFYWTDENYLTINDYVRFMGNPKEVFITDDEFKDQLSSICNRSLPANHSALWECLISRQAIQYDDGIKYPVSNFSNIDIINGFLKF